MPFKMWDRMKVKWLFWEKRRSEGKLTTDDGTLAASDLDMAMAVRNTVFVIGRTQTEALQMASWRPAEFLGIESDFGCIKCGYRASLVAHSNDFFMKATWIDGKQVWLAQ